MSKQMTLIGVALAFSMCVASAGAQSTAPDNTKPDNTKANADSANSTDKTSTAEGQRNNSTDLTLTQRIRKSIMADKNLSTYAHNVKIVAMNGTVTLNGVVRDTKEKEIVARKAEEVAGKGNVTNELSIAPPQ